MKSSTKKVLIAEDSSVIQNLTRKILQMQNFDIHVAKNGEQVLQMLAKEDFDIILMDINMPVMDGMECARSIRDLEDTKKSGIPIIAITGNAKNFSMEDFRSAGINDFIPKPLNFDELVTKVNQYTNG
ncbi:response regulator [Cytophagales bacterium LB-30]|uniref:Response regulator n=1 Tax=Shiella aurantiaca TaxID=3058365 RepID=A0ABT8F3Q5_9BACT|nr:response regulator [Shiella aurantiaca]MDN4164909.1 response regulator [Shiella aurantiaca]